MLCNRCCKRKTRYQFCDSCFTDIVERRTWKMLRQHVTLRAGTTLVVIDPVSFRLLSGRKIGASVRRISAKILGIRVWDVSVYRNAKLKAMLKSDKRCYAVVPLSIDAFLDYFLCQMFDGKIPKIPREPRIIPLFCSLTADELSRYCSLKGQRPAHFHTDRTRFLDALEKQHPGTKHAFYRAVNGYGGMR
jgi:hypothetical protein